MKLVRLFREECARGGRGSQLAYIDRREGKLWLHAKGRSRLSAEQRAATGDRNMNYDIDLPFAVGLQFPVFCPSHGVAEASSEEIQARAERAERRGKTEGMAIRPAPMTRET